LALLWSLIYNGINHWTKRFARRMPAQLIRAWV